MRSHPRRPAHRRVRWTRLELALVAVGALLLVVTSAAEARRWIDPPAAPAAARLDAPTAPPTAISDVPTATPTATEAAPEPSATPTGAALPGASADPATVPSASPGAQLPSPGLDAPIITATPEQPPAAPRPSPRPTIAPAAPEPSPALNTPPPALIASPGLPPTLVVPTPMSTSTPAQPRPTSPSVPLPNTAATPPRLAVALVLLGAGLTLHGARRVRQADQRLAVQGAGFGRLAPVLRLIADLQHDAAVELEHMQGESDQLIKLVRPDTAASQESEKA